MISIHPQPLHGIWHSGCALDLHTIASVYAGVNQVARKTYITQRSELGERLFRVKYRADTAAAKPIIAAAVAYLWDCRQPFDAIVPVPHAVSRAIPTVLLLSAGIGAALKIPVVECITRISNTTSLKDLHHPAERKAALETMYAVSPDALMGKSVLLLDDICRTGETLSVLTALLLRQAKVARVYVLTITCTRNGAAKTRNK